MKDIKYDRKPLTACLFFHRDFYLKYHPTLLLTHKELTLRAYKQYHKKFKQWWTESGIGYGYKVFSEGLTWYPLMRSNKGEDHYFIGSIYDDLIFHLGGATLPSPAVPKVREYPFIISFRRFIYRMLSPLISSRIKDKLLAQSVLFPEKHTLQETFVQVKKKFLDDPESYLNYYRTGKR